MVVNVTVKILMRKAGITIIIITQLTPYIIRIDDISILFFGMNLEKIAVRSKSICFKKGEMGSSVRREGAQFSNVNSEVREASFSETGFIGENLASYWEGSSNV